jgi:hypothetical protein
VHSCPILACSDFDRGSMTVGFYDVANAGGRLARTILSAGVYQVYGLPGRRWWSAALAQAPALPSTGLSEAVSGQRLEAGVGV